mmetsp:Transcript_17477/g.16695  ORF Transcript_17477/g.16695 Transcript_17477/m.16695 type:complete len:215 (-) Transcript_17477:966-1610(-)
MLRTTHSSSTPMSGHRKTEIELKEFQKPVVDVEFNKRINERMNVRQREYQLRDIHEENMLTDTKEEGPNMDDKFSDKDNKQSSGSKQNLNCSTEKEEKLKNGKDMGSAQKKANLKQMMENKIKKQNLALIWVYTILAVIMLTASIFFQGFQDLYMMKLRFAEDEIVGTSSQPLQIYIIPFYSQQMILSCCLFLVSFFHILVQNLITYRNYGIFH